MTRKINYTTIPRNGLVAEYLLDGNANATVGTNGSAIDMSWVNTDRGYQKQAGSFNSSIPSSVSLHNRTFGNNFSISINYKWDGKNNSYLYLARNTYDFFAIIIDSSTNMKVIYPTGSGATGTINIPNPISNKFQVITITKTINNISVYIDAKYIGGANVSIPNFLTTLHYIGSSYYNNSNAYSGLIQGVRIYDITLSQDEITNIYQEFIRRLGPSVGQIHRAGNNDFPLYSLPNLESGKILEISKPKVGSNYINQIDGSSLPITGIISDTTNGKYNQINLTGTQYINCGDIIDETKGTIILTYKPTRIYSYNSIFDNAYNENFWEMLIDSGANLKVRTSATLAPYTDNTITKTGIVVNKTYRIAYSWNTSLNQTKLYLDGVLVGTNNHQTPPATTFYFGGGNDRNTRGEGGLLYGVLYNRTLSDAEILQDYYAHKIV